MVFIGLLLANAVEIISMDKPVTKTRIHAILRKAGFASSKKATTGIRGWHRFTEGYILTETHTEAFKIEHQNDSQGYGSKSDPVEMVNKYCAALKAAGVSCGIYGEIVHCPDLIEGD
jgi:hypothetical protein